jgi:hypothetical protein
VKSDMLFHAALVVINRMMAMNPNRNHHRGTSPLQGEKNGKSGAKGV